MSPKTLKIAYWFVTILFALAIGVGGVFNALQAPDALKIMRALGYPDYFSTIIGVAKILGVVAILQWKFKTIKEWAYAGFAFDILGASLSYLINGDGILLSLSPLVFLAIMFASYFLWKKTELKHELVKNS